MMQPRIYLRNDHYLYCMENKRKIVETFIGGMSENWINRRISSIGRMNDLIVSCLNPKKSRDASMIMLHLNSLAESLMNLNYGTSISQNLQESTSKFGICCLIIDELEVYVCEWGESGSPHHFAMSSINSLYRKFIGYV